MKPLRLEVRGFTAFRETAIVEFEPLRLFVITGPTGAGKSSLLDAMIWALYGQVPRVGNATRQLITHGEKSMSVRFDFTARGNTYRVSRHVPGGVGARLEQLTSNGEWSSLADRSREVTDRVTRTLGLDYQTFTKTIVLPQGAFDSFLRGDERDRRAILTRLLGLDTYLEAGSKARARATSASDVSTTLQHQLDRLDLASPKALSALESEKVRLESQIIAAEERREQLTDLVEIGRREEQASAIADNAREAITAAKSAHTTAEASLVQADSSVDNAERHLRVTETTREDLGYDAEQHRRLSELATLLEQQSEALTALDVAKRGLNEAEIHHSQEVTKSEEQELEETRTKRTLEHASMGLSVAVNGATAEAARLRKEAEEADRAISRAEAETDKYERRVQELSILSQRAGALAADHRNAQSVAEDAITLAETARVSSLESAEALRNAEAITIEYRKDVDEARARDAAATLQRTLRPGDPCPICGSPIEHLQPHPAPDLDLKATKLAQAEQELELARLTHEKFTSESVRMTANEEHARSAVALSADRLAELEVEIEAAGTEGSDLADAIESAHNSMTSARNSVTKEQEHSKQTRAAERDLSLLMASVDDDLPNSNNDNSLGMPPSKDAIIILRERLGEYEQAVENSRSVEERTRASNENLRAALSSLERAQDNFSRATETLASIEHRLDSIAATSTRSPETARAEVAAMDRAAERARELDIDARTAETERAAAVVRRDERHLDVQRTLKFLEESKTALTTAESYEELSTAQFQDDWKAATSAGLIESEVPSDVGSLLLTIGSLEQDNQRTSQDLGAIRERLQRAEREAEEAARMKKQIMDGERLASVARALEQELHSDRFIAFVQREALQILATDASSRLLQLSHGRYRLIMEEDEFAVVDRLNGDERRSVRTLSGGETFLASLSLSLSLSERLPELAGTGGAGSLESLFLDEGFGSLDSQSLDVAIEALEALSGGQRMVGVISHVPQLAERLQHSIEVVTTVHTSGVKQDMPDRTELSETASH